MPVWTFYWVSQIGMFAGTVVYVNAGMQLAKIHALKDIFSFDLLLAFVRNPDRVFSRSELLDLVWGVDRDIVPNTVETYISYLRKKVDSAGPPLIHTLRGAGYSLRVPAGASA